MKYYVEAYYDDGRYVCGNGDGQGVIHAKEYKRTQMYNYLRTHNFRSCIKCHKIVEAARNVCVEVIEHV